jgi:hypothetical protein
VDAVGVAEVAEHVVAAQVDEERVVVDEARLAELESILRITIGRNLRTKPTWLNL